MPSILSKLLPASIAGWLSHPRIRTFRDFLVTYFLIKLGVYVIVSLYDRGLSLFLKEQKVLFLKQIFRFLRPLYNAQVKQQSKETVKKIQQEFVLQTQLDTYSSLPKKGLEDSKIRNYMELLSKERESRWKDGKASGSVYSGSDSLAQLTTEAYRMFCWSNPLHPDLFPGLRKMEAEVVSMVLSMYNAREECCGTVTSGGTESILLAVKACRDYAEAELGITAPELVVPVTAHAAFDKAASYFKIHIIHAPVNEKTGKVDTAYVRRVVTRNTILIVGSAPGFPHGIIDDIEELASIARRAKRPLHVDCCLGGFLLPFMEKANFPLPPFDFRVPGVTSISCDTHKYGFAPKGSSVIMYASNDLRKYQYFVAPDWPGGIYASPTLAGSRPGALVAGCWATMLNIGEEGYINATKEIISAARKIDSELRKIPGIFVCGTPLVSVVGFGSKSFNILCLSDELAKKGWNLNPLQYPPSVHICVTHLTVKVVDKFIEDVKTVAAHLLKNPPPKNTGTAAIYGLAQSVPDRSIVNQMAGSYLDALYIP